jgi:hypothetical protein
MIDLNIDYVENLTTRFLPLETWGFVESVRTEARLIYNSLWCRLRFYIHVDGHSKYLFISYGRLHAVEDKAVMKWKGEDCYCWIDNTRYLRLLLQYLEGLAPEEAHKTPRQPSKFLNDFESVVSAHHPEANSIELEFIRHATIWERYGLRFFELFDLRRPDLWDSFIVFMKEYFRLDDEELDAGFARKGLKRTHPEIPPYRRC